MHDTVPVDCGVFFSRKQGQYLPCSTILINPVAVKAIPFFPLRTFTEALGYKINTALWQPCKGSKSVVPVTIYI